MGGATIIRVKVGFFATVRLRTRPLPSGWAEGAPSKHAARESLHSRTLSIHPETDYNEVSWPFADQGGRPRGLPESIAHDRL